MQTMTVGDIKANFSQVLKQVEQGELYTIAYGRVKKKVAVIVPYDNFYENKKERKLGILKKKASYKMGNDYKITEEELVKI